MGSSQSKQMLDLRSVLDVGTTGRHRSKDTLHVISQVLAQQTESVQKKDEIIEELRSEVTRLTDTTARINGLLREKEARIEKEVTRNLTLRKDLAKKCDIIHRLQMRVKTSRTHQEIDIDPIADLVRRQSSYISYDEKENRSSSSETDSSTDIDEYEDPTLYNEPQAVSKTGHLALLLKQLRSTQEQIWMNRENNGEDPVTPQYDDDLKTAELVSVANELRKQISEINKESIVTTYRNKIEMMEDRLCHKSKLYNVARRVRVNFDSPRARQIEITLKRFVHSLMQSLVESDNRFVGKLIGAGSYFDGTKLFRADELDFVYVMTHPDLAKLKLKTVNPDTYEVTQTHQNISETWRDMLNDDKLEVYVTFTNKVQSLLTKTTLPPGVIFGGLNSPKSSGVRKNRPALTLNLICKGQPVDVDIAVAMPASQPFVEEVLSRLPPHVYRRITTCTTSVTSRLHHATNLVMMVQADGFGHWKATTTCFEVNLFRSFPFRSQIQTMIVLLKYINHSLLTIRPPDISDYLQTRIKDVQDDIVNALCNQTLQDFVESLWRRQDHDNLVVGYLALRDLPGTETMYAKLRREIWKESLLHRPNTIESYIHPSLQSLAHEKVKPLVSTSSCIFKYAVLGLYVQGVFVDEAVRSLSIDDRLFHDLLKKYYKEVNRDDEYDLPSGSIAHPFLRFNIPVSTLRNHTGESLSGVHNMDNKYLVNTHRWKAKKLFHLVNKKPVTSSVSAEHIYQSIGELISNN